MSPAPFFSRPNLDHERAELRRSLVGLAVACPFYQGNPASCQLCHVRTLPMAERIKWVDRIPTAEMHAIYRTHQQCLRALERNERK